MSDDPPGPDMPGWIDLTVWGVPGTRIPSALHRMALHRRPIRRAPGLRFAKLLGTGSSQTFSMRDVDLRHWALLSVWDDPEHAAQFQRGAVHAAWQRIAREQLTVQMVTLRARGHWSGVTPFQPPERSASPAGTPVAVLTRARLRPLRMIRFWQAVPPVAADLNSSPGLMIALSLGESPIGFPVTFSMWSGQQAMTQFAYRSPAHRSAMQRTGVEGWFAEELFARFAVRSVQGSYRGQQFSIVPDPVHEP